MLAYEHAFLLWGGQPPPPVSDPSSRPTRSISPVLLYPVPRAPQSGWDTERGGGGSTTIVGKSWRHFVQYCVVPKSVFDGGYRLPPPASDPSNRPMRSIPPVMLLLPPCLVRRNRDGREGWCPPAHRQLSTQVKMSVTVPMCANPSPCPTPGTGHGRQRYTTASSSSRAARSRRRSTRQRYRPLRSLSPPPPHPN